MSVLIDSDVVIDYFAAQPHATDMMPRLRRGGIAISTVTYMEIVEGVTARVAPRPGQQALRAFMRGTRVIVVSRPVAERAAAIRLDLRRRKRPVAGRVLDIIVAATAIEHGLTLVTRNLRDYEDIVGLRIYPPQEAVE